MKALLSYPERLYPAAWLGALFLSTLIFVFTSGGPEDLRRKSMQMLLRKGVGVIYFVTSDKASFKRSRSYV